MNNGAREPTLQAFNLYYLTKSNIKKKMENLKMTNTKNETMNAETETHLKLAGALNEIVELFTQKDKDLSEVERLQMFDSSLGYLCDNLGIDLDMYEELKSGGITLEDYEDLRKLDEEEQKNKVVTLKDGTMIINKNVNVSPDDKVLESAQVEYNKNMAEIKNLKGHWTGSDNDDLENSQFVADEIELDEEEPDEPQNVVTVADELKELYSLNDSMFTGDPNHVPTYTDGTVIKQQDLADMNMNGLQRIAEIE